MRYLEQVPSYLWPTRSRDAWTVSHVVGVLLILHSSGVCPKTYPTYFKRVKEHFCSHVSVSDTYVSVASHRSTHFKIKIKTQSVCNVNAPGPCCGLLRIWRVQQEQFKWLKHWKCFPYCSLIKLPVLLQRVQFLSIHSARSSCSLHKTTDLRRYPDKLL